MRTMFSREDILFPPGINNPSNVCYANSILQCLFNQQIFRDACASARCNCNTRGKSTLTEALLFLQVNEKFFKLESGI